MIQISFFGPESCLKPLKLLWYIGTRCGHYKEIDPEDQSKVFHLEFDVGKSQVLLLYLVALKFLLPLLNSNSKAILVFLGLLRLTEPNLKVWLY